MPSYDSSVNWKGIEAVVLKLQLIRLSIPIPHLGLQCENRLAFPSLSRRVAWIGRVKRSILGAHLLILFGLEKLTPRG